MDESERMIETMYQVYRSPREMVASEIALEFPRGLGLDEKTSNDDPPGWADRHEQWEINGFLGMYEHEEKQITIFEKALNFAAAQMEVQEMRLRYVVRVHEWSHAAFHLAVAPVTCIDLERAKGQNESQAIDTYLETQSQAYTLVEEYVHEQLAQVLTYLVLGRLFDEAERGDEKNVCKSLQDLFEVLTRRQPCRYKLQKTLRDLERQVLSKRLGSVIPLLRNGSVKGDKETWDTIMPW